MCSFFPIYLFIIYLLFHHLLKIFLRFYLFICREKGREGEREGEKYQGVVASRTPPAGELVHNPGMCLTRNQTSDPLVCRPTLSPVSYTSQGPSFIYIRHSTVSVFLYELSDIYLIFWVIIHYCIILFFLCVCVCSNCFSFGQWELFLIGSYVPLICLHLCVV